MPERHSTGESSGSSSNSSGGSSWHSSSSSSSSSWRNYGNGQPTSPEDRAWAVAILIIIAVCWIGVQVINALQKNQEEARKANATATTKAITIADLKQMHQVLDERIEVWKRDTKDTDIHRVVAEAAGFGADMNTKEVDYGYCDKEHFYVFVIEASQPGGFSADTEGYSYTTGLGPTACHPPNWRVITLDPVENGWYFITLNTSQATFAVMPTRTPVPPTLTPTAAP